MRNGKSRNIQTRLENSDRLKIAKYRHIDRRMGNICIKE
jgi:hypothetical protein